MKKNLFCVAVLLSGVSLASHAQSGFYTEASYWQLSSISHASTAGETKSDGQVVSAIVGYPLSENLSLEGMVGTGLSNADVKLNGATQTTPVTQKLDAAYGAYVRAKIAITNDVDVFARAGRNAWHTTASTSSASTSNNFSDWTYGVGVNYNITKSTYLSGSWMTLYNKDNIKIDGYSLGVGVKF